MPHPKFTYAPSGNSCAARCAICSRLNRVLSGISHPFRPHDSVYKNRRRDYILRRNRADRHNFIHLHDCRLRRHGHNRIEIPRCQPVRQVPEFIGLFRLDQRELCMNRLLQDAALPVDLALFLAIRHFGSHTYGRIETHQSRSRRAHPLAQDSLRHQLAGHFPFRKSFLKMIRVRPGKRTDHVLHLSILEHDSQLAVSRSAIIADRGDPFYATFGKCLDQIVGKTCSAKSTEHNPCAVRNIGYRRLERTHCFLFHWVLVTTRCVSFKLLTTRPESATPGNGSCASAKQKKRERFLAVPPFLWPAYL